MHPLVGLGVGWGQNVTKHYLTYNGNKTPIQKRVRDDDSETESDNEILMKSETNWPRFLIVESASEDLPLQMLSPFPVQKGFQAIVGILKNIKRLRDGSFLVECGRGPRPKTYSELTDLLTDQSRSQFTRP